MKACVATTPGNPSVLEIHDVPDPVPGPGELLVEVEYAGLNFIDTYRRSGVYETPFPHIPGAEGSGRVIGRGSDVEGWWDGTRVAWAASASGSYAEKAIVKAGDALYVPDHVEMNIAAALPLQGMTAHYLINSVFPVTDGTKLVVTGAAGGVGRIACQLASGKNAIVIATTSTEDKLPFITHATYPLVVTDWSTFPDTVKDLVGEVDVVYDGIGKASFDYTLATLRRRGLMCLFGGASGQVPPFDLQRLNAGGGLFVTRPSLAHYLGEEQSWRWNELMEAVRLRWLDVLIGKIVPLDRAREAHELIESGTSVGKTLISIR